MEVDRRIHLLLSILPMANALYLLYSIGATPYILFGILVTAMLIIGIHRGYLLEASAISSALLLYPIIDGVISYTPSYIATIYLLMVADTYRLRGLTDATLLYATTLSIGLASSSTLQYIVFKEAYRLPIWIWASLIAITVTYLYTQPGRYGFIECFISQFLIKNA